MDSKPHHEKPPPPTEYLHHTHYPLQRWTPSDHKSTAHWFTTTSHDVPKLPRAIRGMRDSKQEFTGRTLVICLDGTGDSFDNDNSNVVHFVSCLKKDDPNQLSYYQAGIGTYSKSGLQSGISAAIDMAVGSSLGVHVCEAYRFLMQNYREGDRICLLGFSRGSYTVRCLAGMLHKVGLLPAHNTAQVIFAYKFYKDESAEGWKMSAEFKKTFCTNVNVYFVGVWDSVASVGFIPRKLPFSKSPTNGMVWFRHAMAMDEHRAKFKVCRWDKNPHDRPDGPKRSDTLDMTPKAQTKKFFKGIFKRDPKKKEEGNKIDEKDKLANGNAAGQSSVPGDLNGGPSLPRSSLRRAEALLDMPVSRLKKTELNQEELEQLFNKYDSPHETRQPTDVKEVWFMGAHADCGGGAVANETRHMLSRIPLRWMVRQCFECDTGILFSTAGLAEIGLDVPTLWPTYQPPHRPVVDPSPKTIRAWQDEKLPPLRRRSSALGVGERGMAGEGKIRVEETYHDDGVLRDRKPFLETGKGEGVGGDGKDRMGHNLEMCLLPEQVEDYFDARAGINDQLVQAKGWWILEFWPIKVRILRKEEHTAGSRGFEAWKQDDDTHRWVKVVRWNLGRYRVAQESEPLMHWTVDMMLQEGKYRNRIRFDPGSLWKPVAS